MPMIEEGMQGSGVTLGPLLLMSRAPRPVRRSGERLRWSNSPFH
jgi:hypothetical protein